MKATKFLAVLLIGLAFAACTGKPGEQLPKEFQPTTATVDSVSYLLGINSAVSWLSTISERI